MFRSELSGIDAVCLSVCRSVCLSVCLFVGLSVRRHVQAIVSKRVMLLLTASRKPHRPTLYVVAKHEEWRNAERESVT